jgi:DNA-binding response OmpR family regulator
VKDNKKILIVDDEFKIIEVLKSYLEHNGFEAEYALNGKKALELFNLNMYDLVILDLMLPDISGEEVCKKIRENSRVPIIMLTAKIDEKNIIYGLDIGADDYITKPFSPKEVIARVIALLRRASGDEKALVNILSFNDGELIINNIKYEVTKNGEKLNLTPNEFKILKLLAIKPNKTFMRSELIECALGNEFNGFDRTIDSHIRNLRNKIENDSKYPKYIKTIHGIGYRFGV